MGDPDTIRELNDDFRQTFTGGIILTSVGVNALSEESRKELLLKVQKFDEFNFDNDPFGEHDFGAIEHEGEKYCFKIDCYDHDLKFQSPNPADPTVTTRTITIMKVEEY